MTEDVDGAHVFALVSTNTSSWSSPLCTGADCSVRRFDAQARIIDGSCALALPLGSVRAFKFDPIAHRVVLGRPTGCSSGACTGFSVDYVRYE
jgi:hypothetical protein